MALTKISDTGVKTSNTPSNGKFLQYKDDTDKLTWATATTDVSGKADKSGDNFTGNITFPDDVEAVWGGSSELQIGHDGTTNKSVIQTTTADPLLIKCAGDLNFVYSSGGSEATGGTWDPGAGWTFLHGGSTKLATSSTGVTVTGVVTATSFSGSGANLTNLPPGGNSIDLVADGAIGAGKPVIVTTAGKVKAIGLQTQAGTSPSIRDHTGVADNTSGLWGAAIWHSTTSRGLLVYRKYGGNNDMRVAQFSMNSTAQSISCGASRQLYGNVTMRNKIIMDPDIDKPIVFWQTDHGGDKHVYSRSVTMNGNGSSGDGDPQGSTQGSSQPIGGTNISDGAWDVCYDTNANIFVFVWRDSTDSGKVKVRLGYQSEPSTGQHKITWINTNVTIDNDGEYPRCVFDTVNNKVIFAWGSGGGHDIGAAIGTVSNSGSSATISVGTVVTVSGDGPRKPRMAWHPDSGQAGFLYQDASNNYNKIITLKTSGTTVHYTASTRVGTENVDDMTLWYSSGTKTLRTGTKGRFNWISSMGSATSGGSSSTAPTVGSGLVTLTDIGGSINDWEPNYGFDLPDHSIYTGLFTTNGSSSNQMKMITFRIGSEVSNATASNVIGFAENAINDTATGTIKLTGNVVGNQSGLTPGEAYYIQGNGTLGTGQDNTIGAASGKSKAGVAVSATTLKIADYA